MKITWFTLLVVIMVLLTVISIGVEYEADWLRVLLLAITMAGIALIVFSDPELD